MRRLLFGFLVSLAALLAAGLAVASAEEPPVRLVTTLEAGDNQITWQHGAITASDLFDDVPQIEVMYRWDNAAQRWLMAAPSMPSRFWTLHGVDPGDALHIRVNGNDPVHYSSDELLSLGANTQYLGWIGEPTPATALFGNIPNLDSIRAWDANGRYWTEVTRNGPGSIRTVYPGMGLRLQLSGGAPMNWEHPDAPAAGLVELYFGDNLISWAGPNDAAIADVVKGIGTSFVEARMWNAEEQRFHVYSTTDTELAEDFPLVNRGDALWIKVSRRTNWLQPAGTMPTVRLLGSTSASVERKVTEALEKSIAFFADQFGIQPDLSDVEYLVPSSVNALINHFKNSDHGCDESCEATYRDLWDRAGGWAGGDVVVKQSFYSCYDCDAGTITTHELFHVVQHQLGITHGGTTWLTEGTASWSESQQFASIGQTGQYRSRVQSARQRTASGPSLKSTEVTNQTWQYQMGEVAVDMLVSGAGVDAPVEFYRSKSTVLAGPTSRWELWPSWQQVFEATFGTTVEDFYDDYDNMQAGLPGRRQPRPEGGDRTLRGTVERADGTAIASARVTSSQVRNGAHVGWNRSTLTADDGSFELFVPSNSQNQLYVDLADNWSCTVDWTKDGVTLKHGEGDTVVVQFSDPPALKITVPNDVCGLQITGRVVGPNGDPLGGVKLRGSGDSSWPQTVSQTDGHFALTVPEPGEFRMRIELGACSLRLNQAGEVVFRHSDHVPVAVITDSIDVGVISLSEELCLSQLSGQAFGDLEAPSGYGRLGVSYWSESGSGTASVDARGRFALTVPKDGAYRVEMTDGACRSYVSTEGVGGSHADAVEYHVSGMDVLVGDLDIPTGFCGNRIVGKLVDKDQEPVSNEWVSASGDLGSGGGGTDREGAFEIAVPMVGEYRLRVYTDGCFSVLHHDRGHNTTSVGVSCVRGQRWGRGHRVSDAR